jgi:hypothetical protein
MDICHDGEEGKREQTGYSADTGRSEVPAASAYVHPEEYESGKAASRHHLTSGWIRGDVKELDAVPRYIRDGKYCREHVSRLPDGRNDVRQSDYQEYH